jgi:hypothetical protein
MTRSTQLIPGSVLTATAIALFWFKAPIVPAVAGALTAGLTLLWGNRRPTATCAESTWAERRPSRSSRVRNRYPSHEG